MHLILQNESATQKFIWTIKNFNRLSRKEGFSFKSSIIHQRHARRVWRFFLYPAGRSDKNYMAAYFNKAYSMFDPVIYNCSVSIRGSNGKPLKSLEFQCVDLQRASVGGDKCLRRDSIEKLLKGSMTVQCEITEVSLKSFYPSIVADFENLSLDLTVLYKCPMFYDLTVRIQQLTFFLHTCVLFARCRRLSHVFGYQSFNQMPKFIQIDDISPYLFQELVIFLYSSKLEGTGFSLDLFLFADKLKLQSLKRLVYEKVHEYRTDTEIALQTVTITWNLKEIQFREKDTVPFVQIFQAGCCLTHLAVRVGILEHCEGEKYIDISFEVFLDTLYKPVSLLCVMTLFCNGKVHAYKKDSYSFEGNEEWHFPPFVKLSDIPESKQDYVPDMCLTAEVSLSDGCTAYDNLHTKIRLFPRNRPVVYPERFGADIGLLLSANLASRFKKHDISLKSIDNCCIPAHKAILWARWPAIRDLLKSCNETGSYLPLNLCSEEIQMLLNYIYTGFVSCFDYSIAEKLLQANARVEYPPYIVRKCRYLLYGRTV